MDGSLPKKPCKTCKNRFHAGCLYKVRCLKDRSLSQYSTFSYAVVQLKPFAYLSSMPFRNHVNCSSPDLASCIGTLPFMLYNIASFSRQRMSCILIVSSYDFCLLPVSLLYVLNSGDGFSSKRYELCRCFEYCGELEFLVAGCAELSYSCRSDRPQEGDNVESSLFQMMSEWIPEQGINWVVPQYLLAPQD